MAGWNIGSTGNTGKKKKTDVNNVADVVRETAGKIRQDTAYQEAADGAIQMLKDHTSKTQQNTAKQPLQTNSIFKNAASQAVKSAQHNPTIRSAMEQAQQNIQNQGIGNGAQGGYQSPYGGTIQQTLDQLLNGEKFSYDFNADPLYQQARDKYRAMGQTAMLDTMGQATALTGGYGNSYAASAAQQAYQQAAGQVNDIIPELQAAAYDRYRNEIADTKDKLSILQGLDETAYNRNRDSIADARYEDETAYNRNRDSIADARYEDETAYNRNRDSIADARYEDETAYNRNRDSIADARYEDETAYNRNRDSIADARYEDETAYNRQQDALDRATALASTASSGSSSGRSLATPSYVVDRAERAVEENDPFSFVDYLGGLAANGTIATEDMNNIYNAYFDGLDQIDSFTSKEEAVQYLNSKKNSDADNDSFQDFLAGIKSEREWKNRTEGYTSYSDYLEDRIRAAAKEGLLKF